MPEFFLKKLFRGVKKAFKSVGKVLKKVAPIVLPFVLGPAGLGLSSVYAGAVGAGLGTLIQGGSVKDAFKSALLGGATGAVFSGFSGSGSFGENVSNALSNPVQGGYLGSLQAPTPDAAANLAQTAGTTTTTAAAPVATSDVSQQVMSEASNFYPDVPPAGGAAPVYPDASRLAPAPYKVPSAMDSATNIITGGGEGRLAAAKDLFMPAGPTPAQVTAAGNQAYSAAYQNALSLPGMTPELAAAQASKAMQAVTAETLGPSMMRAYGPAAALGTAGAAAAGFFSAPEEEPEEERLSPEEYYNQDPSKYGLSSFATSPAYSSGPFVRPSPYADGGQVFPRRNGGIMPNEGIPNQDSVRAMLMPGEFVMTTDAVRGLGNGSLNNGINNMYDMMRNLESRGRAFA
jgi:hypothetical protein